MENVQKIKEKLRDKILEVMDTKKVSQAALGRILEVDRRSVHKYLNQSYESTSINKLVEMLNALNVKVKVTFIE